MQIVIVETDAHRQLFLELPLMIYQNDSQWIQPLTKDIEAVFDPQQNKTFSHGECIRWVLLHNGKCIGRIAAFINHQYAQEQPTGGIGFFECINNQEAANLLFDTAKQWLQARNMEAMDGPINFGDRDRWWGLLVSGFTESLYGMNYNPPYYQQLFEAYGFEVYFNQLCFGMDTAIPLNDKFRKIYEMYKRNENFELRNINPRNLKKYAEDFCTVYNKAFAKMGGGRTMEPDAALAVLTSMKQVMDPSITYFVYHKGTPIAMWLNLPDLNQYFKHFKGKLGWWEKLRFLYFQKFKPASKYVGLVYGVVPEWQGKGTDAYMIYDSYFTHTQLGRYTSFEMQWIGDFNPKMVNLATGLGTVEKRRLSTYRYLFDRNKEFIRHPILQ